jgi:hypothetical protein
LYYYRARYYSPELQRFISEDPIGLRGGINKFAYVENNPINKKDALGLSQRSANQSDLSNKDPECVDRCAVQCGGGAVTCAWKALYLPTCELVCTVATCGRAAAPCALVCGGVTVCEVWSCWHEQEKCQEDCVKKCPDLPF